MLSLATCRLRLNSGAGADAFDTLIEELTDHAAVLKLRELWRKARAKVVRSDDPSILAHDFAQLSCALFHRAVCARIAAVSSDKEYTRL